MGKSYKHLNQHSRDRIKALLDDGFSYRKIAKTIGLPSHSTVSREVSRNSYGSDARTAQAKQNIYDPTRAQQKAYFRRQYAKYQGMRITGNDELRQFIIAKLKLHWNPDEIAGYLKNHPGAGFYASKTAIYDWLRGNRGQAYCRYLYSRRTAVKKRRSKAKKPLIPDRVGIAKRPKAVNERAQAGHWEQDSLLGKKSGSRTVLSVKQERTTRLLSAQLLPSLSPSLHAGSTVNLSRSLLIRSVTFDNGLENREHSKLRVKNIKTYFTDPYSAWQKPGVENGNKMLRRYFPKGTDFADVSQAEVDKTVVLINQKPRKILGYKSALQLAIEKGVITNSSGALRG